MEKYKAIGLMSGSSLDGLDIAYCEFSVENSRWDFNILHTDVVVYPDEWIQEIKSLPVSSALSLWQSHTSLGHYFAGQVNAFIARHNLQGSVDLVASHGHTIFHFPEKKMTTQIGDGAAISAVTDLPVVCDFRSGDIADGGQGTPIVPIGDRLLFAGYRFCLNIGGIANVSCKTDNTNGIVAFDICAANQVLNSLANRLGSEYDAGGGFAKQGKVHQPLLQKLNELDFYKLDYPKSLDNGYSRELILPMIESFDISGHDKLCTYTEHIATQVAEHIKAIAAKEKMNFGATEKLLATGGGAFNSFLIERIRQLAKIEVVVPAEELVKFKEALVIALMGVLRMRNEVNVLKSVTGAKKDSVAGAVYRP